MEETECWTFRDRSLRELSSGERQRVHLARALYQKSKWICLDESFSRLDLHHQARIGQLLRAYVKRGYSFLFVSHDLNFTTDWADRCVLLGSGTVFAAGATTEVITEENIRRLYPDADVALTPHPLSGAMKVYFRS
jgi:iron complex transport system ATP-binding protein